MYMLYTGQESGRGMGNVTSPGPMSVTNGLGSGSPPEEDRVEGIDVQSISLLSRQRLHVHTQVAEVVMIGLLIVHC